jgi:hypothetical protein
MSLSLLPTDQTAAVANKGDIDKEVCTTEHCYYAFDALYCNLTKAEPIFPSFPDDE